MARVHWVIALFLASTSVPLWSQPQKRSRPEVPSFARDLYPLLEKADCRACHTDTGVASATRIHFPPSSAAAAEIETFGKGLAALVDRDQPEKSLVLLKPTRRVPHTGGERIAQGSGEEEILRAWVNYLATLRPEVSEESRATGASSRHFGRQVLRRLTHNQYDNTVRDLLGDRTRPASHFPPEDFVNGFKNQAQAQSIPPLLAEAYSVAAEKLARNAFRFGDRRGLVPCQAAATTDAKCATDFIRQFGLRAYRRPLASDEVQRFLRLFIAQAQDTGEFLRGAQIVLEAMLQSPNFLFLVEWGEEGGWAQYEIASRLSYFLWNTMPDEQLFRSAATGILATSEGVEKEARRMLADPRAQDALDEFVSQWMRFDRVLDSTKDTRLYADFTTQLAAQMTEETKRLVRYLVSTDANFMEIFTARYGFLTAELAALCGLPPPSEAFQMVKFPTGVDRAGILGQGTFLAQTGKPDTTSPTERGLFIREHFLCQHIPPPPPGVDANLPPITTESKPMTNRERMVELHMSNDACVSCHRLVDPVGFGLERFDTIGRWHEMQLLTVFPSDEERKKGIEPKKYELELDTSASIAGIPNSEFSSVTELGKILAGSPTCQTCIVKQLFRYAWGRGESAADRPTLDQAFLDFRDSGFQFRELIISLVTSDTFRRIGGG